jgi:TolB-like protein
VVDDLIEELKIEPCNSYHLLSLSTFTITICYSYARRLFFGIQNWEDLMLRRSLYLFALLLLLSPLIVKGQTATGKDIVLVLPFENTTSYNEYNWIGQSFADALSDLLNITGLAVLSSDEREMVYQRMRLPTTVLPSRATAIKIAREAKATLVLFGTYSAIPTQDGGQVQIQGTARLVRVGEGRYEGRL